MPANVLLKPLDTASLDGFEEFLETPADNSTGVASHSVSRHSRRSLGNRHPELVHPIALQEVVAPEIGVAKLETKDSHQIQLLNAELTLMKAQLEHALNALERAQQRQAYLKIELCAAQDKLSMMPDLLIKAARLRYLENRVFSCGNLFAK